MKEPDYLEQTASFDDAEIYRYTLLRRWAPGPMCLWILLNPSTATAIKLDPTLQRCLQFTMSWTHVGQERHLPFGAFEVCNAYAFRSPHPEDLWKVDDPVGPNNDAAILSAAKRADLVIVGWGDGCSPQRERQLAQLLCDHGIQPHMLAATKRGSPSHPLARGKHRIPYSATPTPWHAKGLRP